MTEGRKETRWTVYHKPPVGFTVTKDFTLRFASSLFFPSLHVQYPRGREEEEDDEERDRQIDRYVERKENTERRKLKD